MSQPQPQETQQRDIIDLTEEYSNRVPDFTLPPESTPDPLLRLPCRRSGQQPIFRQPPPTGDVIDLSEEDDVFRVTGARHSSPEIQFLSSRTRSRSLSANGRGDRVDAGRPPRQGQATDLQNSLPWSNSRQLPSLQTALRHAAFGGHISSYYHDDRNEWVDWGRFTAEGHVNIPSIMDVQAIGFNLDRPHRHTRPATRPPTYDVPPPPRQGFTRSPRDDDLLVCPNCEDELGVGEYEVKRQVWVVKACGHVCHPERRLMNTRAHPPGRETSQFKTQYLVAYNLVCATLWLAILGRTILLVPLVGFKDVYGGVGEFAKWTQTLAVAEVVHSALGMSDAALNVASRLLLVWPVLTFHPDRTRGSIFLTSMYLAWSVTEVVRYSYFVMNLQSRGVPGWLSWLRYNTFYVLYPVGITSECILVVKASMEKGKGDLWKYFFWVVLAIYVPGSYVLFTHMIAQRRKIMRGKGRERQ
ncbi:MAG: hypothetical protein Q9163_003433 [Psora crenata]